MPDNTRKSTNETKPGNPNRDPITGAPGSHPVGTGVGAAAGGAAGIAGGAAAGAAAGTAGAGPIGGAVGAAVGAVVGGLAGKGVAESVNPTAEDAYWREHYNNEPYYDRSYSYDDYQGAYRTGYEGYGRLGSSGKRYEDIEPELRREYERNFGASRLNWERARPAVRAAWHRFDRNLERYIGYDVVDQNGNKIGTLECLWADHMGEPEFVGVRTGWFMGKTHVVPAESVQVSERGQRLKLPYSEDKVKNAPAYDSDREISDDMEREVYNYYGIGQRRTSTGMSGTAVTSSAMTGTPAHTTSPGTKTPARGQDSATVQLTEEQLRISKREVEAGGVRLRKIIRTETVNQPVELRREEIVIERVPASGSPRTEAAFSEQEIFIPLRREEPIVQKEAHVREEVRVHKENRTETQHVSGQVRKEDVQVEHTGDAAKDRPPQTRKP